MERLGVAPVGSRELEGAGIPRGCGTGELDPEAVSRDRREAPLGVAATLGRGAGEPALGDPGPDSPDTAREAVPPVLLAARVARRLASISFADAGMASITACKLRDSPWICNRLSSALSGLVTHAIRVNAFCRVP